MISLFEKIDQLPQVVACVIFAVIFGTALVIDRSIRWRRWW